MCFIVLGNKFWNVVVIVFRGGNGVLYFNWIRLLENLIFIYRIYINKLRIYFGYCFFLIVNKVFFFSFKV